LIFAPVVRAASGRTKSGTRSNNPDCGSNSYDLAKMYKIKLI